MCDTCPQHKFVRTSNPELKLESGLLNVLVLLLLMVIFAFAVCMSLKEVLVLEKGACFVTAHTFVSRDGLRYSDFFRTEDGAYQFRGTLRVAMHVLGSTELKFLMKIHIL